MTKILYTLFAIISSIVCATDLEDELNNLPKPTADSTKVLDTYKYQFTSTLIVVIVIIVAAVAFIYLLRRFSSKQTFQINHHKNIKILERRHLSPNTYLYHIEIGNKQFVIAESKCNITHISDLNWEETKK